MQTISERFRRGSSLLALAALAACGGGGDDEVDGIALETRVAAAQATAKNGGNACAAIQPFYWEIGDADGREASGSLPADNPVYASMTAMPIASASKWLYGAYVVERRDGAPTAEDIAFLNFTSGYTSLQAFPGCDVGGTVDECLAQGDNGDYHSEHDGLFHYNGGHMQTHASQAMGLGDADNAALTSAYADALGADIGVVFTQPQLAGGVTTTPAIYGRFLQRILSGDLAMRDLLGSSAVCTNPATCATASYAPIPESESWSYSLGHWVETDPVVGDGAFSSAGAFGFYPWIDAGKRWYGVLARVDVGLDERAGYASAQCGRLIRAAWLDGQSR